jgi:hypothetical protein
MNTKKGVKRKRTTLTAAGKKLFQNVDVVSLVCY